MAQPPSNPKIYHITHLSNLEGIIASGGLISDALIQRSRVTPRQVGMSRIKERRLKEIEVSCHPGTKVGEYVPFYFCVRSVMLYVVHCANHPDLQYRDGQDAIVHLQADLRHVVAWADQAGVRWAFSLSNAGARFAEFRASLNALHELDWDAIASRDFRDPDVKERKQAEFLVYERFPFHLIERIGVRTQSAYQAIMEMLSRSGVKVPVAIHPNWYF